MQSYVRHRCSKRSCVLTVPYLESEHTKVIVHVLRMAQLIAWIRRIDGR